MAILYLYYKYLYLHLYLKNRNLFITNYDRHNIQTRHKDNLYTPTSSRNLYQNGAYYTGIKIFNKLPPEIRELVQMPNIFKSTLQGYLVQHCFYKLEEFYTMNG
jgi:hypothetical protein